jgi:heme exporter protein CcmD
MGGYAFYVWGSVGVCVLLMLIEVWQARAARLQVLAQLQTDIALNEMANNDTAPVDSGFNQLASSSMASNRAQQDTHP